MWALVQFDLGLYRLDGEAVNESAPIPNLEAFGSSWLPLQSVKLASLSDPALISCLS